MDEPRLKSVCPNCQINDAYLIQNSHVQLQQKNEIFQFLKCKNCSLIYLNMPPNSEKMSEYYHSCYLPHLGSKAWGKYAKFVDKAQISVDMKKLNYVNKYYPHFNEKSHLLDYGCGKPTFLDFAKKKSNAYCSGLDISEQGWGDYKINSLNNLNLVKGIFSDLNKNIKFNVITLWHVLEHEYNPVMILQNLKKIIAEDGILIIEVPNHNSFFVKIQKGFWAGYHTPRHTVVFTKQTITNTLARSGWNVVKYKKYGTLDAFTLWWLGRHERLCHEKNTHLIDFEPRFLSYLFLKIITWPFFILERIIGLGVLIVIAKPKNMNEKY
ncbi:class I SAM-dependent methyltransferase [Fluviispira multicolorata]|uniref:Methyltransferase domain-containing protein n=1 Tax=Fluviispira multicolorata TaxID=2654512 RepID=A0A833N4J0_9BACT|nr:class I SAM-dependent methyltransferase [Fluviispira multicolorata]KAB8028075.1 methyltransferase domain-containing protein [Fluviispira multicolorata]